jgi:pimeloyl-ACP methyl ester carboxylesterase
LTKEYQLIIPDLRGHGRSTNPTGQFTLRQSALDIFALLDELKIDRFKSMGGSGGGLTLLHMATQQAARVEAMVLIGTPSYWSEQCRAFTQSKDRDWDWDQLRQRHVYGDDQIRTLLDQFYSFADKYDDAYANFTPPYLSTITAKTLIVDGDRDPFIHASMLVEMYTFIPHAYLWVIPNGRHMAVFDKHAAAFTQTALEFLRGEWETE